MDEALLEKIHDLGAPLLRFYGWREAAATFGYFQKIAEVEKLTPLRPLIRRPTGGGIVPHDVDWTYSLIFPPSHRWYSFSATQSYRVLHEWIQNAFGKLSFSTRLATAPQKEVPGQCFVGFEKFDLLFNQNKIAGAAQRRTRHGLLIQGSIQPPVGIAKADWQKAMCDVAHEEFQVQWQPFEMPGWLGQHAQGLLESKYGTEAFNRKR